MQTMDRLNVIGDRIHCPQSEIKVILDRIHCPPDEIKVILDQIHCPPGEIRFIHGRIHAFADRLYVLIEQVNVSAHRMSETQMNPEDIVTTLRDLRAHIPEYVQLPQTDALALRRASQVSPPFLQATLLAAAEFEPVAALLGRPVADQRQEAIDADRWLAVEPCSTAWPRRISFAATASA